MTATAVTRVRCSDARPAWPASWPFIAGLVVVTGAVLGIGTQVLQGALPGGWGVLANSGVMWAFGAFALGHLLPTMRWAVVGGAIELVIASWTYYLAVEWFEGIRSGPQGAVIWSAAGIVAGSVFGYAGQLAGARVHRRPIAWSLLAGTLAGEGVHLTWFVGNPALRRGGVAELILAAALSVWCLVTASRRTWPGVVTVAAALSVLAAGRVIDGAFANW